MIRFPPVDAALEGFRLTRERPLAILIWVGVLVVVNLAVQAWLAVSGFGAVVAAWQQAMLSGKSPAELAAGGDGGGIGPAVLVLGSMAANAVLYTAVLRMVLQPHESRFGYLRLGMAELRQFALSLLLFIALTLYVAVVTATLGGPAGGGPAALLRVLFDLALLVGLIYAAVRLSLAPSMTFADGRLTLIRAWSLTRGQFWGLFGAYVLAFVLAALVSLLSFIVFGAAAQSLKMATHDGFDLVAASASTRGGATLAGLLEPTTLVLLIFSAFWTTLAFTIINAVAPAAFKFLSDRSGQPA